MVHFATDSKLRKAYFEKIDKEVKRFEDSQHFYNFVNRHINQVFEKAYLERLNSIYQKSRDAQNLEKRRMFIRFKKFLMQSRLLTFMNKESERTMA